MVAPATVAWVVRLEIEMGIRTAILMLILMLMLTLMGMNVLRFRMTLG